MAICWSNIVNSKNWESFTYYTAGDICSGIQNAKRYMPHVLNFWHWLTLKQRISSDSATISQWENIIPGVPGLPSVEFGRTPRRFFFFFLVQVYFWRQKYERLAALSAALWLLIISQGKKSFARSSLYRMFHSPLRWEVQPNAIDYDAWLEIPKYAHQRSSQPGQCFVSNHMRPGGLTNVAHAFSEGSRVRKNATRGPALALMPFD